jgi:hypothetical protein
MEVNMNRKSLTFAVLIVLSVSCRPSKQEKNVQSNLTEQDLTTVDLSDEDVFDAQLPDGNLNRIEFTWKDSGKIIDGKGKSFNNGKKTMITFTSIQKDGVWKYPENIVFRNWKINGALRVLGVGPSSDTGLVKTSSQSLGHTKRMREAAPRNIVLENLSIVTDEKIPVVFGPGVHKTVFRNSMIAGQSRSVAMYIDAESGDNIIENNIFNMTASREVIALDGSARNLLRHNLFLKMEKGGVHIYRNSGERGVVRHQEPRQNRIIENYFNVIGIRSGRAVFLGSRNGTNPNYRHDDAQFNFGSGASNRDYAQENAVLRNIVSGDKGTFDRFFIKDTEGNNDIQGNKRSAETLKIGKIVEKFGSELVMPELSKIIDEIRVKSN